MAHSHTVREYPGQLVAFMAASAAVGAGAALLFTPRTGKQYRERIKLEAVTMKDRMRSKQSAAKAKSAAKDTAKSASTAVRNAKTTAKSTSQKLKSDTKATAKRAAATGKDLTDQIRRNGEP